MEAITKYQVRTGNPPGCLPRPCIATVLQGMPVLADGRVDFEAASQWISQHVDRAHSGWAGTRRTLVPRGAALGGNGQTQTEPVTPSPANITLKSPDTSVQWRPPEVTAPLPKGVPA